MPFSIVARESGATHIALGGDLDVFTSERLRPELVGVVRRDPVWVEVDFSRLRSTSPHGMRVLVSFFADLARIGCRITITGIRDQPFKCFKATLVDAILNASQLVN